MGKIKGWRKVRDTKKFETWINYFDDSIYTEITKYPENKFAVRMVNPLKNTVYSAKLFYNHKDALRFATKHMRSHPKG